MRGTMTGGVLALALALQTACGGGDMGFDTARWIEGRGAADTDNPRIGMVADAARAGVRPGATRATVRALLGEPDGTGPDGDVWFLGRSTVAPDFQSLHVDYRAGIVTAVATRNS